MDDIQAELASATLDNTNRYVEVIVDQDVRQNLIQVPVQQKEKGPEDKSRLRMKDVNHARRKLDTAIRHEDMAEENFLRLQALNNGEAEAGE